MEIFIQREVPGFDLGYLYATDDPINQETGVSADPDKLFAVTLVIPAPDGTQAALGLVEDSAVDLWLFLGRVLDESGALARLKDSIRNEQENNK